MKNILPSAVIMLLFTGVLMLRFNIRVNALDDVCYLFVAPPIHVAEDIGELFNVTINITAVENLQSVEFTVTYNTSLLDVAQVVQGTFFPPPPKSHFELEDNESLGFIRVNMALANLETPKNGDGTLVSIRFKVVQAPESCVSSPISLQNTLLLDPASIPIIHDSVSAVYFWKSMQPDPLEEGQVLDLYTLKGGIGPDKPGGQFILGELMYLLSRVTHNDNPLQQKLVAFEVQNPLNESAFRTAVTDENGIAAISFRIPSIPSSIGNWTAISVVDIAGKTVWDTMTFEVYSILPVGGDTIPTRHYATANPLMPYPIAILTTALIFMMIRVRAKHKREKP